MNRAEAENAIRDALVDSVRDRANYAFSLSQIAVPVVTGFLKQSGTVRDEEGGSVINYKAPYASNIERGTESHYEPVAGHVRKGKYVKGHIRAVTKKEGKHFIEKSLKQSFEGLSNIVDMFLRVKFPRVERR